MRKFMMNGSGIGQIISDEKSRFFASDKGEDSGDHIRNKADQPSCSKKKEQEQKGADSCFYRNVGRQFCIENYLIGQFIKHGFLSNRGAFLYISEFIFSYCILPGGDCHLLSFG